MKKRKLKKQNKRLREQVAQLSNWLTDARHELQLSEQDKRRALEAVADVWRLERDHMGQQGRQRTFAAITSLGGAVKVSCERGNVSFGIRV